MAEAISRAIGGIYDRAADEPNTVIDISLVGDERSIAEPAVD